MKWKNRNNICDNLSYKAFPFYEKATKNFGGFLNQGGICD